MTEKKGKWKFPTFLILLLLLFGGGIYLSHAYNLSKAEILKEAKEKEIIEKTEKEKKEEEKIKEVLRQKQIEEGNANMDSLMPGTNHNRTAKSYAYDTKKIRGIIRGEEEYQGEKLVFLTFDDGVNDQITPQVLDILKENNVPATFFIMGGTLNDGLGYILERELREGHGIALHSQTHDYTILYPGRIGDTQAILREVDENLSGCQHILGNEFHSRVFRYPGGHMSWDGLEEADQALEERDVYWMDWNALVGDAEPEGIRPEDSEQMMDFMKMTIRNSANPDVVVLLMHDAIGKNLTLQTLPQIIEYFKTEGFRFGILE